MTTRVNRMVDDDIIVVGDDYEYGRCGGDERRCYGGKIGDEPDPDYDIEDGDNSMIRFMTVKKTW